MSSIVPIIVGPTGVGKTALSVLLAEHFPVEIVSADSRQIYKYMDIGTAKPDKSILKKIPHHFIDILEPNAYYSAGLFAKEARDVIQDILKRKNLPLVVGGSGLYIRALVDGIFESELRDEEMRRLLDEETEQYGLPAMYRRLQRIDPEYAGKISSTDQKRILRALEVWRLSGRKFSELQKETQKAEFEAAFFGLTTDRSLLYTRINQRVDRMLANGLLEEVQRLKEAGYTADLNALNTVGYKEVFAHLNKRLSYDEMVEQIKRNTRRYAKRQLTWFRQDKRIHWMDVHSMNDLERIAEQIVRQIKNYPLNI